MVVGYCVHRYGHYLRLSSAGFMEYVAKLHGPDKPLEVMLGVHCEHPQVWWLAILSLHTSAEAESVLGYWFPFTPDGQADGVDQADVGSY